MDLRSNAWVYFDQRRLSELERDAIKWTPVNRIKSRNHKEIKSMVRFNEIALSSKAFCDRSVSILPGTGRWRRSRRRGPNFPACIALYSAWDPSALRAPPRSGEDWSDPHLARHALKRFFNPALQLRFGRRAHFGIDNLAIFEQDHRRNAAHAVF